MKKIVIIAFLGLLYSVTWAQNNAQLTTPQPKRAEARRISVVPKIDGVLDDAVWEDLPVISDFTQLIPDPGQPSSKITAIKMGYDNRNIYIAAMLFDEMPKKIRKEVSFRDTIANDDYFSVSIDSYNDQQNAFLFGVTAAGVQVDGRVNGLTTDYQWNVIWKSAAKVNEDGWAVEMEIPYASLRFPNRIKQQWNINFQRTIRRLNEVSYWSPIDPKQNGTVQQFGKLDSVSRIKSPLRLSLIPYIASTHRYLPNTDRDQSSWIHRAAGGLDLKLGLGKSFTLDMSLIPDFGQVISDDIILNLTPFEVRFDENRPFFTESVDIFNRANLFYSRRIGGRPSGFYKSVQDTIPTDSIRFNPDRSRIVNAVKISGRNRSGLGFGVFNAVHNRTYAEIIRGRGLYEDIQTEPYTNFNVLVLDQLLPNNSYISFINTNVIREGRENRDANVTGGEFRVADKKNKFAAKGSAAVSRVFLADSSEAQTGWKFDIGLQKISGKFRFELGRTTLNHKYDPTDAGFLLNNNQVTDYITLRYLTFQSKGALLNTHTYIGTKYDQLYQPNKFSRWEAKAGMGLTFKSLATMGFGAIYQVQAPIDYFEARLTKRAFRRPQDIEGQWYATTDPRKKIALGLSASYTRSLDSTKRDGIFASVNPRFRITNHINFVPFATGRVWYNDIGYADTLNKKEVFGVRNRREITLGATLNIFLNPKTSLSIRGRHLWATAAYKSYNDLNVDGTLTSFVEPLPTTFTANRNFNAFNIDAVFRWQFSSGSELNFIWKNKALIDDHILVDGFTENLNNVLSKQHQNLLSLKILYYLDSSKIRRRKR
jgi:hypothetical protein